VCCTKDKQSGRKLCIPNYQSLQCLIIGENHDAPTAAHLGLDKTVEKIKRQFYWPTLLADTQQYIKSCEACQRNKARTTAPAGLLQPLSIPKERWERISMDFITQLPTTATGFDAIVIFIDYLTKRVHAAPTRSDITAPEVARLFLDNVFRHHGLPREIVSDRDPKFTSMFWQSLHEHLGTKLKLSSALHPQTDGQTERFNRTLKEALRCYVNYQGTDWDKWLGMAEFAYNNSIQASTRQTPFYLDSGRNPYTPLALFTPSTAKVESTVQMVRRINKSLEAAKEALERSKEQQKQYADQHRRDIKFELGEQAWLSAKYMPQSKDRPKTPNSFAPRYIGPFRISQALSDVSYKLDLPANWRHNPVFHVSELRKYHEPPAKLRNRGDKPRPLPEMVEGKPEYVVEKVLDKKGAGSKTKYLVFWKGYPLYEATWEPRENLKNAQKIISDFEKQMVIMA
jgi:transposase InsO family protein